MNSVLLDKLKKKPQPKTKEEFFVLFKASSKDEERQKTKIVIQPSKPNIEPKEIISTSKVATKSPITNKPEIAPTAKKSKKLKLVSMVQPEVPANTTRVTKRPDPDVVFETDKDVVIKDEFIQRLPPTKPDRLIKSSTYYMNNREIFVNFINSLFEPYKDELKRDTTSKTCGKSDTGFDLFTHQKIVRDYLNLYTPYRGLLLYHGLGSGKTCSSIAIAEGMKSAKNVLIMTPAALRMNYIEELKNCGDPIFKKNQYWDFIEATDDNTIKQLSKILSLPYDYVQKNGGAWLVDLKKPTNYDTLGLDDRTKLDNQITQMIRFKYQFINYNGIRNESLDKLTNNDTINPFDNKVIVIDEAHNFVSRIVNKLKRPESISMRLYHYLMSASNCKIVLLSGTPIINYPNELAICFNILRGYIKTWNIPLNIKTESRINNEILTKIIESSPRTKNIIDFVDYKPSSKIAKVTFNPLGFVNSYYGEKYKGVKPDSKGQLDDAKMLINLKNTLLEHNIEIVQQGIKVDAFKALPDDLEQFKTYFIETDTDEIKNENLFKRRILGLTSYYGDIEHLMPKFNKDTDFTVVRLPMSDYMFGVYESARIQERKIETSNKRKRKQQKDLYEETVGTYRIFSRAFCNFVFPRAINRPMPKEGEDMETAVEEADEDVLDGTNIDDRMANVDGKNTIDDLENIKADIEKQTDETYELRIQEALRKLKENASTFLTKEALQIYGPKFLHVLENLQDAEMKGLHLIYTQFRTLEGIGILSLVLEHHGFTRFKIKKDAGGTWSLNISEEDLGKPTFALYTGTEDAEEKEIIRNIYNSDWVNIPVSLKNELVKISSNNFMGEIIKTIMITASGAEGISLKNCRYVHIIEPYWHPVRIDQVIGRARRICSHENLPEELRNIQVFLYLMVFSDKQMDSDASIELRLKDKSKIDNTTPISTDESLFEISNIKERINKKLLKNVKQAAIDCSLHYRADAKDPVVCYSFGSVSDNRMSFHPSISEEENDAVANANQNKITWKASEMMYYGKRYAKREDSDEIYDYDSFVSAISNPGVQAVLIGHWVKTDGKKGKLVKVKF